MKRFSIFGAALFALVLVSYVSTPAISADYEVTLSTIVPTASAAEFTASGAPAVASNAYIRTITLANYGADAVQTVDLYRAATSSTAATIEMTYVVPSSTTLHLTFPQRAYRLANFYLKKSSTVSTVKAQVVYE